MGEEYLLLSAIIENLPVGEMVGGPVLFLQEGTGVLLIVEDA